MKWTTIALILLLAPFFVYVLSRVQMAGWIKVLSQTIKERKEKKDI